MTASRGEPHGLRCRSEGDWIDIVEFRRLKAGEPVFVGRMEDGSEGIYMHTEALLLLWCSMWEDSCNSNPLQKTIQMGTISFLSDAILLPSLWAVHSNCKCTGEGVVKNL